MKPVILMIIALSAILSSPAFSAEGQDLRMEAVVCRRDSGEIETIRIQEATKEAETSWLFRSLSPSRIRYPLIKALLDRRVTDLVAFNNLEVWGREADIVRRPFKRTALIREIQGELKCFREVVAVVQSRNRPVALIILNPELADHPKMKRLDFSVAVYTLQVAIGLLKASNAEVRQNALGVAHGLVRDLLENEALTPAAWASRLQELKLLVEKPELDLPANSLLSFLNGIDTSRFDVCLRSNVFSENSTVKPEEYKQRDTIVLDGFRRVLAGLPYALKPEYEESSRAVILEEIAQKLVKAYATYCDTDKGFDYLEGAIELRTRLVFDLEKPLIAN